MKHSIHTQARTTIDKQKVHQHQRTHVTTAVDATVAIAPRVTVFHAVAPREDPQGRALAFLIFQAAQHDHSVPADKALVGGIDRSVAVLVELGPAVGARFWFLVFKPQEMLLDGEWGRETPSTGYILLLQQVYNKFFVFFSQVLNCYIGGEETQVCFFARGNLVKYECWRDKMHKKNMGLRVHYDSGRRSTGAQIPIDRVELGAHFFLFCVDHKNTR